MRASDIGFVQVTTLDNEQVEIPRRYFIRMRKLHDLVYEDYSYKISLPISRLTLNAILDDCETNRLRTLDKSVYEAARLLGYNSLRYQEKHKKFKQYGKTDSPYKKKFYKLFKRTRYDNECGKVINMLYN